MRTTGFFRHLATTALAGMVALGPAMHADALRIMVVGDSISHGTEGDFTWRYRLWEWFRDNGVSADFVGPYTGTHVTSDPAPPGPPRLQGEPEPMQVIRAWGGYARGVDAAFPRGHFAVWGRQVAQAQGLIHEMVAAYQPEMLLVELGFNDLGWFVSGPQGTLMSMGSFVAQARHAKADIKFAIANVPQRTFIGGRDDLPIITHEYNTMLANEIPKWSTAQSPIILVPFRTEFQCEVNGCPAAYDGLHPNSLGEYQIARAFSMALNYHWNIGKAPLTVPSVVPGRDVSPPTNFRADSSALGVTATWDKVYGATGYDVRSKIKGFGDWVDPLYSHSMNRADTVWTVDGLEWEYMVRTAYGNTKGSWIGPVSAVAHPQTAPGPKNIKVIPTGDGATLTWDPPDGSWAIDRYEVITYDQDTFGAFLSSFGVRGRSATVSGLKAGNKHVVAVTTWTNVGGGLPAGANAIRPGAGTPAAPRNLRVWTTDGATVKLTHDGSAGAAGYRFYTRNVNDPNSKSTADPYAATDTCWGITFLFPGAWNYEFCVTAFNGDLESGKSNCVIAPKEITPEVGGCPLPPAPPSGPALPPDVIPGDQNWQGGGGGGGGGVSPGPVIPNENWQKVTCTDIGVINDNDPIDWRWAQLHANEAWADSTFAWRQRASNNKLSFTEFISNYFNGPRGMECHKLAPANGCKGNYLQCHDTNYPAGYFILNSFIHLSSIMWNFWDALRGSRADIATDANTMVDVFSPVAANDAMPIAIIIDIVTLGYAAFAAPFWNSIMKNRSFFRQNGNTHGVLKDGVNGAVAGSLTLVKDVTRADSRLSTANELVTRLKAITDIWFEATETYSNFIFNGENDGLNRMKAFIDGGRLLDEEADILSSREIEALARRALFAMLIPVAWKVSGRDLGPFILNGKIACDDYLSSITVSRDVQDKTRVCVDGQSYFLVGASEPKKNCQKQGDIGGVCDPFKALPGMDQLDGRLWGGVTKEDIVIGALNSYKKNGDKNGGKAADPVDYDFLSTVQDINIRAPGIINVAVCGAIEAERNYWNAFEGKHSTNYPCD